MQMSRSLPCLVVDLPSQWSVPNIAECFEGETLCRAFLLEALDDLGGAQSIMRSSHSFAGLAGQYELVVLFQVHTGSFCFDGLMGSWMSI